MYPAEVENQKVLGINKLPGHSYFLPFNSASDALKGTNPAQFLLNGFWKFSWVPDANNRPTSFFKKDFDDSKWKTIKVPSSQEIEGYGTPIYTNITYPFNCDDPPRVQGPVLKDWTAHKEPNPCGSYRKTFSFSPRGRSILCFLGVQSHFHVWINSKFVGYSQSSFNPAEFDVTDFLVDGKNTISVQVYKYGAGSYCEDQDMFRFSGIFRDVYIYSLADLHIWDVKHQAGYNEHQYGLEGVISSTVTVKNTSSLPQRPTLTVVVYRNNESVGVFQQSFPMIQPNTSTELTVKDLTIENPDLWSAEYPNLYKVVTTVNRANSVAHDIGFRHIQIKNSRLYINGTTVLLKGVNRHDVSAINGKAVTRKEMLEDIKLMKNNNINTVRTSHYPNHPYWVQLCNQYGLYVVAEANLETHGVWNKLTNDPEWEDMYVDRQIRNVQRDYNNPSIVIWSLGNECGDGVNFIACRKAVRNLDTSRPIHFQSQNEVADIDSTMYPSVEWLHDRANEVDNPKPFFICEYSHAMGNAMGNMKEYWDLIKQDNRLIGGCVWEWQDHGIRVNVPGSDKFFYAYGGNFGDAPNDNNFCMDGILGSAKEPTAKLRHMKECYQYVDVEYENEELTITNNYDFTDLDQFALVTSLYYNGTIVTMDENRDISCAPGQQISVKVLYKAKLSGEYLLNVDLITKAASPFAPPRHSVGVYQFVIKHADKPNPPQGDGSEVNLKNTKTEVVLSANELTATFNKLTGAFEELRYRNGVVWNGSHHAPALNFTRAHIDNDKEGTGEWDGLQNADVLLDEFRLNHSSNNLAIITTRWTYESKPFTAKAEFEYRFHGDGTLDVAVSVFPLRHSEGLQLARIGIQFTLATGIEYFSWYGRGPYENYSDRHGSERIGKYSRKVGELGENYSKPQATGNHEDVRWVNLTRQDGRGFSVISTGQPISFTGYPYSETSIAKAKHPIDLPLSNQTVLQLDAVHRGLGNASCGPETLAKYNVPIKDTTFSFQIRKLGGSRGCGIF